jgi:putative transposase
MPSRYPTHLPGFSYLGFHQYSLTFCTEGRAVVFTDADTVSQVLSQFMRAAREDRFAVIVYCFMPDHVHLVVGGTEEDSDLKNFIRAAKQYSGYDYKQRVGKRLWQRYGHEHVIRDDEQLRRIVRYILENPVRAGLVKDPRDYPFLGSGVYTLEELIDFAYDRSTGERRSG